MHQNKKVGGTYIYSFILCTLIKKILIDNLVKNRAFVRNLSRTLILLRKVPHESRTNPHESARI